MQNLLQEEERVDIVPRIPEFQSTALEKREGRFMVITQALQDREKVHTLRLFLRRRERS